MVRVVVAEDVKPVGGKIVCESHIVRLGLAVAGRDDEERSARMRFQGAVLAGRDATAVTRQPFHPAAEELDHVGPVVSLAAERKKLPDQFGERALDIGAVVEEADADTRRSGLRPVKPAPHDLARHGEVGDIAGSRRWNRGHGLLQQQA